ncbi:hypothetical protein ACQKNS_04295 [Peribacillus sp. NPDC094092]
MKSNGVPYVIGFSIAFLVIDHALVSYISIINLDEEATLIANIP